MGECNIINYYRTYGHNSPIAVTPECVIQAAALLDEADGCRRTPRVAQADGTHRPTLPLFSPHSGKNWKNPERESC